MRLTTYSRITTAAEVRTALAALGSPRKAGELARFFKTAPGQYGEGDHFLGLTVPLQRQLVAQFKNLPLEQAVRLLKHNRFHEERLTALLFLVRHFQQAPTEAARKQVVAAYLANLKWVNNWDLVDLSAPHILGAWLINRDRSLLYKMVTSRVLWQRRIAILATFHFIYHGQSHDTLALAEQLLDDQEDLMHKAAGWMLREVGKRVSLTDLRGFLKKHAPRMPRTMLRYAIERLSEAERQKWMAAQFA
jgi:3-methyladenine DNA glycosylase AlkD